MSKSSQVLFRSKTILYETSIFGLCLVWMVQGGIIIIFGLKKIIIFLPTYTVNIYRYKTIEDNGNTGVIPTTLIEIIWSN